MGQTINGARQKGCSSSRRPTRYTLMSVVWAFWDPGIGESEYRIRVRSSRQMNSWENKRYSLEERSIGPSTEQQTTKNSEISKRKREEYVAWVTHDATSQLLIYLGWMRVNILILKPTMIFNEYATSPNSIESGAW